MPNCGKGSVSALRRVRFARYLADAFITWLFSLDGTGVCSSETRAHEDRTLCSRLAPLSFCILEVKARFEPHGPPPPPD